MLDISKRHTCTGLAWMQPVFPLYTVDIGYEYDCCWHILRLLQPDRDRGTGTEGQGQGHG